MSPLSSPRAGADTNLPMPDPCRETLARHLLYEVGTSPPRGHGSDQKVFPMEFDLDVWQREPASPWLVKCADEHVHAGTIQSFSDAEVVMNTTNGTIHFQPREVDWIRPLIEVGADHWRVMAGFQAEDTTFDTWWMNGDILVRINYSAPTGFSDLLHFISPRKPLTCAIVPSQALRAQVRPQISRILAERRGQRVPPIAHLQ